VYCDHLEPDELAELGRCCHAGGWFVPSLRVSVVAKVKNQPKSLPGMSLRTCLGGMMNGKRCMIYIQVNCELSELR